MINGMAVLWTDPFFSIGIYHKSALLHFVNTWAQNGLHFINVYITIWISSLNFLLYEQFGLLKVYGSWQIWDRLTLVPKGDVCFFIIFFRKWASHVKLLMPWTICFMIHMVVTDPFCAAEMAQNTIPDKIRIPDIQILLYFKCGKMLKN